MTTKTTTATTAEEVPTLPRPNRFASLAWDLARSEWTKLRTVRSTYWTLLCTSTPLGWRLQGVSHR